MSIVNSTLCTASAAVTCIALIFTAMSCDLDPPFPDTSTPGSAASEDPLPPGLAGQHTAPLGEVTIHYWVVDRAREDRTRFLYTFAVEIQNTTGATTSPLELRVSSSASSTITRDPSVTIGELSPGLRAPSFDSFTLLHDRTVPFDPSVLTWTATPWVPFTDSAVRASGILPPSLTIGPAGGGDAPAESLPRASVEDLSGEAGTLFVTRFDNPARLELSAFVSDVNPLVPPDVETSTTTVSGFPAQTLASRSHARIETYIAVDDEIVRVTWTYFRGVSDPSYGYFLTFLKNLTL
jgi:hypothetical protein